MHPLLTIVRQASVLPSRSLCRATLGHRCMLSAVNSSGKHNPQRWLSSHATDEPEGKKKETLLRRFARIQQKIIEEEKTFGKIVYESKVAPVLMAGKIAIYGTSVLTMSSFFTTGIYDYTDLNAVLFTFAVAASVAVTLAIPVSAHYMTQRFVLRLYYRQDKNLYTAVKFNKFIGHRNFQFTPEQITPYLPRAKGTLKAKLTTFYLDQEPMYVNKLWFGVPKYFNHLMGYEDILAKPKPDVKFWRKKLIQK